MPCGVLDLIAEVARQSARDKNRVYEDYDSYLRPVTIYRSDDSIPTGQTLLEIADLRISDVRDFNLLQPEGEYERISLSDIDVAIIDAPDIVDLLPSIYQTASIYNKYGNFDVDELRNVEDAPAAQNRIENYADYIAPIKRRVERNFPSIIDFVDNFVGEETPLGEIARKEVLRGIGENIIDNAIDQTVGRLNTDIFGLLQGDSLIRSDFKITIPRTPIGQTLDIASRLAGLQLPFSYIPNEAFDLDGTTGLNSEERLNILFNYTGRAYQKIIVKGFETNKYNPTIEDNINGNYYIYYDGDKSKFGGIEVKFGGKTLFVSPPNDYKGVIVKDENNTNPDIVGKYFTNFENEDENLDEFSTKTLNRFSPDSLLYKTKRLFLEKSNVAFLDSYAKQFIYEDGIEQQTISRGSSITSFDSFVTDDGMAVGKNDYFRTFTKARKYNTLNATLRHRGLDNGDTRSVLGDNGLPFIAPTYRALTGDTFSRFMFSISNMAWKGHSADLPECEKYVSPNGDVGRRMWFAPYDLSISETSTQSVKATDFFGRPEPVYTTSNTRRTANVSFALVVDYPDIIDKVRGQYTHIWERYFRGDRSIEDQVTALIQDRLTPDEQEQINRVKSAVKGKQVAVDTPVVVTPDEKRADEYGQKVGSFYFPNEVMDIVPNNPDLPTMNGGYENGDGIGLGYTYLNGKQKRVKEYIDRTDNGLNTPFYNNGTQNVYEQIKQFIASGTKNITVYVLGYASAAKTTRVSNKTLSKNRALNMIAYLQQSLGEYNVENFVAANNVTLNYQDVALSDETDNITSDGDFGDEYYAKVARRVDIYIKEDDVATTSTQTIDDAIADPNVASNVPNAVEPIIDDIDVKLSARLFFDKCKYFKYLEKSDPLFYDTISQKIDYFHPAFHSYTPQNFNERLTFLQQCVRSANNIGVSGGEATNLFYGYQSVVYISIGDWFRTKAIINSVSIDYNAYDLVWDFNPESGAGVQPMIAKVSLSLDIIGGQTMSGALNRLQNALSFNFYSNTEMYDVRSDSLALTTKDGKIDYEIIDGLKLSNLVKKTDVEQTQENLRIIQQQGNFLDNQINFDGSNVENANINSANDLIGLKQLLKL